jgi:nicotinamidase/pyrazinamidase
MIFFDVDTQHDFMDTDGALAVPDAAAIRPNLERLLRAAGRFAVTTISSRCAHEAGDPEFDLFPPHCLDGTPGAERIFADLPALPRRMIPVYAESDATAQLRPCHYVVRKKTFDPFTNRWLDGLRQAGAFRGEICVLFGVATDYCVRACGLGLAAAGARVLLVEDAIRGVAANSAEAALAELHAVGVECTTTDEVLSFFARPGSDVVSDYATLPLAPWNDEEESFPGNETNGISASLGHRGPGDLHNRRR